jgi:hypothetical protein
MKNFYFLAEREMRALEKFFGTEFLYIFFTSHRKTDKNIHSSFFAAIESEQASELTERGEKLIMLFIHSIKLPLLVMK